MTRGNRKKWLIAAAVAGILAGGFLLLHGDVHRMVGDLVHSNISPGLLILLFLVLPVLGAPIIPFYMLIGFRLGVAYGLLLMGLMVPVHLAISYVLGRYALRPLIEKTADRFQYKVPSVSAEQSMWFSFLFMAAPGPSYAMKNYLLALSGVSFGCYFFIGWLVQCLWGIPFIVLGEAAYDGGGPVFLLVFALLVAAYFFQKWARRKHNSTALEMKMRPENREGRHS